MVTKRAFFSLIILSSMILVSCSGNEPVYMAGSQDDTHIQSRASTRTIEEVLDIVTSNYDNLIWTLI